MIGSFFTHPFLRKTARRTILIETDSHYRIGIDDAASHGFRSQPISSRDSLASHARFVLDAIAFPPPSTARAAAIGISTDPHFV